MTNLQLVRNEDDLRQKQHEEWVAEVQVWQRETERLAALLYLLDRALPEHEALLRKHVFLIERHNEMLKRYECGTNTQCLTTCSDYKDEQQQLAFQQELQRLYDEVENEHKRLKREYQQSMQRFYELARHLFDDKG